MAFETNCLFRQLSRVRMILVIGLLCHIRIQCMARAINLGNTWTMPTAATNVFYRFFRDRISWFEADAVCQFHHANLVTIENSYQFDATRDLLRELDVNDIVWIGLMRPQTANNFIWSSNSKQASINSGYWAESLPLLDAQLCTVIDPIRDYRWHALRCTGPETASFLCEMAVPNWADACLLKTVPNVTIQYMADTATVELIRNCQEEGLLQTSCSGKEDHEQIFSSLMCPRERLEIQHSYISKPLQIIKNIPTDNKENNNIEVVPFMDVNYGGNSNNIPSVAAYTEKNEIDKVLKQFNVEELIHGHEGTNKKLVNDFYKFETSPPNKKSSIENATTIVKHLDSLPTAIRNQFSKQNISNDKYEREKGLVTQQSLENTTTKIVGEQDLSIAMKTKAANKESSSQNILKEVVASPKPTMLLQSSAVETIKPPNASINPKPLNGISLLNIHEFNSNSQTYKTSTTTAAFTDIIPKYHLKQSENNSPFIPPMLLVKSHYISAGKPLRQLNYKVSNNSYHHATPQKGDRPINRSVGSPVIYTEPKNLQSDLLKQQVQQQTVKSTYGMATEKDQEFKVTTSKAISDLNYSPLQTYKAPQVNTTTEHSTKQTLLKAIEGSEGSNNSKSSSLLIQKVIVNTSNPISLQRNKDIKQISQDTLLSPSPIIEGMIPIFNRQRRVDKGIEKVNRTSTTSTTSSKTSATLTNIYKTTTESVFYKPNRHRTLTKPQSASYIKRMLG